MKANLKLWRDCCFCWVTLYVLKASPALQAAAVAALQTAAKHEPAKQLCSSQTAQMGFHTTAAQQLLHLHC